MARIIEWDEQQYEDWAQWVALRPKVIQDMCEQFPPYNLYRLKNTGRRVTLHSYSEDNTLSVNVTGEYNSLMFDRHVFGIKPEDLEECDLPSEGEQLGTILTEKEDVDMYIDKMRPIILADKLKGGK